MGARAEVVGGVAEHVDVGSQREVFGAEAQRELVADVVEAGLPRARREAAQRVEDHGDVDDFLEHRTPCRREVARRRDDHGDE